MLHVALLTFTQAGHTAHFSDAPGHTLRGYDRPDAWKAGADELGRIDYEAAWVLDLREALSINPYLGLRSPLVDPTLPQGTIERCPSPNLIMAVAMAGNEFGTLLALQETHRASPEADEPGPLDSISVIDYVTWWANYPGVRIGEVVNGSILWHERTE